MSLEYCLEISARVDAADLLQILGRVPGFSCPGGSVRARGLYVHVGAPAPMTAAVLREEMAFVSCFEVMFRIDAIDDRVDAQRRVFVACASIAAAIEADLALIFNGETPLLLRVGDRVRLRDADPIWARALRDAFPDAEFAPLPSL